MPQVDGTLHRNAVHNSTIEHRNTVYLNDFAHVGKTAGGAHNVERTLAIVVFGEIHRLSREAVGGNHLESMGITEISVEIVRQQLVWKLIIQEFAVEDAALRNEMSNANILITSQIVDVRDPGTTRLATDIRHAIAGTSRNRHHVWEIQLILHKGIEHATRKDATHASPLQDQTCITS